MRRGQKEAGTSEETAEVTQARDALGRWLGREVNGFEFSFRT